MPLPENVMVPPGSTVPSETSADGVPVDCVVVAGASFEGASAGGVAPD
ncbi:hypothetical protein [Actinoplanes utahensis]|nr:hypothetical protein [Actinoplanes utahensis]